MSRQIENLYKVNKKNISKVCDILVDSFQNDPFWENILKDLKMNQKRKIFESGVRYCIKYGEVYASSENLEGIIVWISRDYEDMTIWRMIRSGSFLSGMKLGLKKTITLMKIYKPLEVDRKAHMKGKEHIYLMIIGVASKFQGKGFGGKMLKALIEESEMAGIPVYLETTTERNLKMFQRHGFKLLNKVFLPIINLPQWEMIREPQK